MVFAVWTCVPDRLDSERAEGRHGVLVTTIVAFFLAEMGDKTQLATAALAARFQPLWAVIAGTTLGMLLADAPAVWMGDRLSRHIDFRMARYAAAALFLVTGVVSLLA
jgi:putative Ca2+/H+ antiporter (TMEM165/GDT1 family)